MNQKAYLKTLNSGQRIVESAECGDAECDVCGARGDGDPCGICRELAVLAMGGNSKAAAELAARSSRPVIASIRAARQSARQVALDSLVGRVRATGRTL